MSQTTTQAGRTVNLTIDAKPVTVEAGTSVWEACRRANGQTIPALCHSHFMGLNPVGVCRVCVVDILNKGKSGGNYAASCMRECEQGMEVLTGGERLEKTRRTLLEVLLADHPVPCAKGRHGECDLERMGIAYGLLAGVSNDKGELIGARWAKRSAFAPRDVRYVKAADRSNFSIAIDHAACILCDRCVRACADVKNDVIGRSGKGARTAIGFDAGLKMGDSGCVNCGECMISCPTGAITYSGFKFQGLSVDEARGEKLLTPEEMKRELPLLDVSRVNYNFLQRSQDGVALRRFGKDEVICQQGQHGRTAFYIKQGSVTVYLEQAADAATPARADEKKGGLLVRLGLFKPRISPSGTVSAVHGSSRDFIPIDAPIDLDRQRPIAVMGEGAIFGEASCINHQRRSATVRAGSDDTVVIEMTRNFLDVLARNRDFRVLLERIYRNRGVNNNLRASPLFAEVDDAFLKTLAEHSTLVRCRPGDLICRQGERADSFFIVRIGHVKVEKAQADGQHRVLRYMAQSSTFGEVGLLLEPHLRTTTCTALDDVEMIRIAKDDFDNVMAQYPGVREELVARAKEYVRPKAGEKSAAPLTPEQIAHREALLSDFFVQEIYQGQSLLVLDLERCTRCDECVKACAQTHNTITRLTREGLRFDKYLVTTSCRSCHDPKCLAHCPVDAIHRKEGLPIIIENYCVGCGACAENCPYGNITLHEDVEVVDLMTGQHGIGRRAMVCDLDNCLGEIEEPSCVYACPHNAAERIDGDKLFERYFEDRRK
ncbi:MAG TPA: cyclic nucleotide-binding domain-containing protein [Tepidisphaeraceae bacterium]|jgi:Fe-S-cluster-containing hydrogenase component 2